MPDVYDIGIIEVFILSLISIICMVLMVIVALSLGMGTDAPWGRIVRLTDTEKTKGLLNVKKNICGCSPPGGNTRRRR